jgi:hypothetical protein
MNKFSTSQADIADCRLCAASFAIVYSPLLLILAAALVLF